MFSLCTSRCAHICDCTYVILARLRECVGCFCARYSCDCEFLFVYVGIDSHVGLWMWLCDGVCIFISVTLCMCMCVWVRGSLVSLLNIKQLEVIKYLGSTGSLWILILPFPSVSQISLFFSNLSVSFFLPVTPSLQLWFTQPLSLFLHFYISARPLSLCLFGLNSCSDST